MSETERFDGALIFAAIVVLLGALVGAGVYSCRGNEDRARLACLEKHDAKDCKELFP